MKKQIILCGVALMLTISAFAQQVGRGNNRDTSIRNTTLDVFQVYKPELKPYARPELQPSLPPPPPPEKETVYNVPQQTLYFSYRSLPLRPLALGKDTTPASKQNYLEIGGGNLSTFVGEAGIGSLTGKDWRSTLLAHFDSREGNIQGQKEVRAGISADGEYNGKAYDYDGGIDVDYRRYYRYGYDHDAFIYDNDQLSTPFTFISAHAGLRNHNPGPYGINYAPQVKASVLFAKPIDAERSFDISLPFTKEFDSTLTASLVFDGAFTQLTADSRNYAGNNIFSISPAAIIHRGALSARIGINPTFGMGNSYLLPQISAGYKIPNKPLAFSAGWEARLIQNTYRELSLKNPFLNTPTALAQTRQDEAFIGAEAGIGAHLALNARGSYQRWSSLPIFINAAPDGKAFDVIYDPRASAVSLQAGAKYQFAESFTLSADGAWYAYLNPTYKHIYGEPSVRLRADLGWHVFRDLELHGYATWLDGIWALNASGEDLKLKPTFDLGGGAEYSLVKQLSLFANISNLLNNRNERWLGYPSFGFNIWGGLRLKF